MAREAIVNTGPIPKDVITIQEMAELTGVDLGTLYRRLRAGKIPFWKPGKSFLVRRSDVAAMRLRQNRWGAVTWTQEESDKLREVYPFIFPEEAHLVFPNRSWESVIQRASIMKIRRGARKVLCPREYNDDTDGGYVSGLVDGEGWFMASIRKATKKRNTNFNPKFGISLRLDDKPILQWLQSYFDCGRIQELRKEGHTHMAILYVSDLFSIMRCILPHFYKYSLRARKRHDYNVWLEMVELQATHFRTSWDSSTRQRMGELYQKLREARRYVTPLM